MAEKELSVIELTEENIESIVYEIRGQKVMLDFDLARIYGYTTKRFNEQVKNNINKFPKDFMFQLTKEETVHLVKSQIVTSRNDSIESEENSWSQNVTLNKPDNLRSKKLTAKNSGVESEKTSRSKILTTKNSSTISE